MVNDYITSTQVVIKTHGLEQGASMICSVRWFEALGCSARLRPNDRTSRHAFGDFSNVYMDQSCLRTARLWWTLQDSLPLYFRNFRTTLYIQSDANYASWNRSPYQNTFETISKTTEGLTFKFPLTVTFPEYQSVDQLGNRRTRELYDQTSSYLKTQRLVPDTKSRRVASQTSIPAPRTTPPPTTTTMVPRGLNSEEIEEDLVTIGLRLRTKKRKRSGAILPWH
ncbi:hypothetical protein M438DRAFT_338947 [Aureobasidium pullulans EXF-150]|uniref:Uncharacterized protein n=1 Tax=Aureobasidium pullulans EXF-150 TaxID=1043002 RepID=A0A074X4G7_AURPU|nr:uncharacterized protein M438DRAFT_338947 [Aureobasidium pullulans EXF-150]KEQ80410.1 hypothetical protein M438DRAFT_338947 [Aureobasidium pullulans EXF-150]